MPRFVAIVALFNGLGLTAWAAGSSHMQEVRSIG